MLLKEMLSTDFYLLVKSICWSYSLTTFSKDGMCKLDSVKPVVQLSGYVNVTPYDQEALRMAIFSKGPISVAIDASHKSLSFYANGVYYEPDCGEQKIFLSFSW